MNYLVVDTLFFTSVNKMIFKPCWYTEYKIQEETHRELLKITISLQAGFGTMSQKKAGNAKSSEAFLEDTVAGDWDDTKGIRDEGKKE